MYSLGVAKKITSEAEVMLGCNWGVREMPRTSVVDVDTKNMHNLIPALV
jgi:hypothetical protein